MARKPTKQNRIDELEETINKISHQIKRGLLTQIKRKDRDPVAVTMTNAEKILNMCNTALETNCEIVCQSK